MDSGRGKGAKRQDELFKAALREFSEHDYESSSLNRILADAGVSKGVFYHFFANKEDLYLRLAGHYLELRKAFLLARYMPEDLTGGFFNFLRKSIAYSIEFSREDPAIRGFADRLIKERGSAVYRKLMSRYTIEGDAAINALVRRAMESGDLRDDLSPAFVARLVSHLLSNMNEILDAQGSDDYEAKIEEALSFIEDGLRKKQLP